MERIWQSKIYILMTLVGFGSLAPQVLNAAESYEGDSRPNFILMIGDDMAVETVNCYNVGSDSAVTPNLDNLCNEGLRFDNFWSQPVCSPTRATLLTGQYGFANGVGSPANPVPGIDWTIPSERGQPGAVVQGGMAAQGGMGGQQQQAQNTNTAERPGLKADAYTFLHALDSSGYQTAAVGKWHLADAKNGGLEHPLNVGFDHYSGPIRSGGVDTYDAWWKSVDGSDPFWQEGYATTDVVDDGIAWLDALDQNQPFFLWVAFNAPHTPFHMPPKELLSEGTASIDAEEATAHQMYTAMIEAMDTEIGRLLSNLDESTRDNTYVVFMGDNGTPGQAQVFGPFSRNKVKGSVYQGGVNVPFIVAGPGIEADQITKSLANSVDIFNTVLALSGTTPEQATALHSVSLAPILTVDANATVREFAYADVFGPVRNGTRDSRTIRNAEYKLVQHRLDGVEELYHLADDPYEGNNLLSSELSGAAQTAYNELLQELYRLTQK